ncbi:threonine/serine exporter family protein [Tissierellaceae bacterium BX21]|uniref:Threonine/serine exporter family protein n=2 Tax=Paratissierella segnis TaxID=2763679 RepID=A0A926ILE9_9FIRM|nr:threonine/serine exporter family protein [Paratissierella segnis]
MDYKKLVETAALAGKIMMESNAESYRVEDTMLRILKVSGLETTEAFAIATALVITLDDPSIDAITVVRRVTIRNTNLNNISQVNTICRNFTESKYNLNQAYSALKEIQDERYKPFTRGLGIILFTSFFALLLGGNINEIVVAGMNGLILIFVNKIDKRISMDGFIKNALSSAFIAIITVLLKNYVFKNINIDVVTASSIMPLLPGAAITNAFRDLLHGDYMSFGAKALEAVVVALSIALGVAIGLLLTGGAL